MTRRDFFQFLFAAPLALMLPWRKPRPHGFQTVGLMHDWSEFTESGWTVSYVKKPQPPKTITWRQCDGNGWVHTEETPQFKDFYDPL